LSRQHKVAVWPGDGIGPEVTREAVKVLEATDADCEFIEGTVGGRAYIEYGDPLPPMAMEACEEVDALLFGAVATDYAPYGVPRKVLTYLRVDRDAYANVRPLKLYPGVYPAHHTPHLDDLDVVVVRENSEGFALRHEGYLWEDKGVDERVITHFGAQRIAMFACNYTVREGRAKVSCIDQSGWLYGDRKFRSAFKKVAEKYRTVQKDYQNVDVAAMMMVQDPNVFDVIVSPDIYGDILSGILIGQIGGVGLAPSACIGENFAFFEPVHGIALDITGKGVANPIASILSAKLMLHWLGEEEEAQKIEAAVASVLREGRVRTPDLGGSSSTSEVGDAIAGKVEGGEFEALVEGVHADQELPLEHSS
jgi:isocitrate/isopropylmalate dehydrogenase